MRKTLSAVFIAAMFASAGVTWAQDTSTTEPETNDDATTASDLDLGTSEIGQPYTKETHGSWEIRCIRTEDADDPCQLYQLLRDGDNNAVAEVNIFTIPEGGEAVGGATIITPLETLLTKQLRLQVDSGGAKIYPFRFCSQIGCVSRLGFTAEDIEQFKRGATATVTISPAAAPDATVDLTMSLTGFTAGLTALTALSAE